MGYTSGAKYTWDLINVIAAGLIGSVGGYWTDADPTYWNTTVKTDNNARRALKYTNGAETFWLALEQINTQTITTRYAKGLRVTFSASWDEVLHTYPTTNQTSFLMFESHNTTNSVDMAVTYITYFLWIDASGFALLGKPEPTANIYQNSFFICVERNANKEYSDGYTNFAAYSLMNMYNDHYTAYPLSARIKNYMRPFSNTCPEDTWNSVNHTPGIATGTFCCDGYGISFPRVAEIPVANTKAYKSVGNGKTYYMKPIAHNAFNTRTPVFEFNMFFPWTEGVGLIDGDLVTIDGQSTQYLCKSLDSPDSAIRLAFAIKYVA